MKTITKDIRLKVDYDLKNIGAPEKTIFFDIFANIF